jgi:hypothetical protein
VPSREEIHHKQLLAFMTGQKRTLDRFYAQKARELAKALSGYSIKSPTDVWKGNKAIERKVNKVLSGMDGGFKRMVKGQMEQAIALNNGHVDSVVDAYTKGVELTRSQELGYKFRNQAAVGGWLSRRAKGWDLSSRVWKLDKQTKAQMEGFLREGLADGTAAKKMATDLKKYLREPDKRFRRVRDKNTGKLKLSEPAKGYKPGRGVYRSSYQNALRMARNEVNLAYRENDYMRRQRLDFVKGVRVQLSPAHPEYDICDEMVGDYPKAFRFSGWHPNCLCFTTTILESRRDFVTRMNTGKSVSGSGVERIPRRAQRYLDDNSEQIKGWSNKPYFLENFKNTAEGFEIRKAIGKPAIVKSPLSTDYSDPKALANNIDAGRAAQMDTNEMYRLDNGELIPARAAFRKKVVMDVVKPAKASTNTVQILGGAPANGKSTFEKSKYFKKAPGTLTINPDTMKERIPEYNQLLKAGDATAAGFAHEESSTMGKDAIRELLRRKKDFVLDGVNGGKVSKVAAKFAGYRDGGRNRLIGNYCTLDNSTAQKLMMIRGKKTGRYIPQGYFTEMQTTMPSTVKGIIDNKLLDEFYLWDTNTKGVPNLILKQIDGKTTMYNEKLWQRFLRKETDLDPFPKS